MTDDTARTVALVLDTSAIAEFCRGGPAVGEILVDVDEEHGCVLVPHPCRVEAAALLDDASEWIELLLAHPAAVLCTDDPDDWRALATLTSMTGSYASAVAAWAALEFGVDILTRHPDLYDKLGGGHMTLAIED